MQHTLLRKLASPPDAALDLVEQVAPQLSKKVKVTRQAGAITVIAKSLLSRQRIDVTTLGDQLQLSYDALSLPAAWKLQELLGSALHWSGWDAARAKIPGKVAAEDVTKRDVFSAIGPADTIQAFCSGKTDHAGVLVITDTHAVFRCSTVTAQRQAIPLDKVTGVEVKAAGAFRSLQIHASSVDMEVKQIPAEQFAPVYELLTQ